MQINQLYIALFACMGLRLYTGVASRAAPVETRYYKSGAPLLLEYPRQQYYIAADGVEDPTNLICNCTGHCDTRILWFKTTQVPPKSPDDIIEIQSDNETYSVNEDGKRLSIKSSSNALGHYRCVVENKYGIVRSHWVHIRKAYLDVSDKHDKRMYPVTRGLTIKSQNSILTVKCANVQSVPEPKITWYKCTHSCALVLAHAFKKCEKVETRNCCTEIDNTKRHLVTKTGTLLYGKIVREDSGNLCCMVRNHVVSTSRCTTFERLNVTDFKFRGLDVGSHLDLLYPETNNTVVSVLMGKEVHIQALFANRDDIRVDWFKNNISLPKFQNKSDILVNSKADPSDAGTYSAVATVIGGNRQKRVSIRLEVQVPPIITKRPVNRNVSANATKLFEFCHATGNPRPEIEWKETVKIDGSITMKVDYGKSYQLPRHKAGTILTLTCKATNQAGYQIAEGIIKYMDDVPSGGDSGTYDHISDTQPDSCTSTSTTLSLLPSIPSIGVGLLLPCLLVYR